MMVEHWIKADMMEELNWFDEDITVSAGKENGHLIGASLVNKPDWRGLGVEVKARVKLSDGSETETAGEMNAKGDPYIVMFENGLNPGQLEMRLNVGAQLVMQLRIHVTLQEQ